jgi:hypothetical protein
MVVDNRDTVEEVEKAVITKEVRSGLTFGSTARESKLSMDFEGNCQSKRATFLPTLIPSTVMKVVFDIAIWLMVTRDQGKRCPCGRRTLYVLVEGRPVHLDDLKAAVTARTGSFEQRAAYARAVTSPRPVCQHFACANEVGELPAMTIETTYHGERRARGRSLGSSIITLPATSNGIENEVNGATKRVQSITLCEDERYGPGRYYMKIGTVLVYGTSTNGKMKAITIMPEREWKSPDPYTPIMATGCGLARASAIRGHGYLATVGCEHCGMRLSDTVPLLEHKQFECVFRPDQPMITKDGPITLEQLLCLAERRPDLAGYFVGDVTVDGHTYTPADRASIISYAVGCEVTSAAIVPLHDDEGVLVHPLLRSYEIRPLIAGTTDLPWHEHTRNAAAMIIDAYAKLRFWTSGLVVNCRCMLTRLGDEITHAPTCKNSRKINIEYGPGRAVMKGLDRRTPALGQMRATDLRLLTTGTEGEVPGTAIRREGGNTVLRAKAMLRVIPATPFARGRAMATRISVWNDSNKGKSLQWLRKLPDGASAKVRVGWYVVDDWVTVSKVVTGRQVREYRDDIFMMCSDIWVAGLRETSYPLSVRTLNVYYNVPRKGGKLREVPISMASVQEQLAQARRGYGKRKVTIAANADMGLVLVTQGMFSRSKFLRSGLVVVKRSRAIARVPLEYALAHGVEAKKIEGDYGLVASGKVYSAAFVDVVSYTPERLESERRREFTTLA